MKKIFTLLTIALFAISAQSQTYKVTAYYEDFSSGYSQDDSSNPDDNEYGIDFDGQKGFTTWSQDNAGSATLDNNNWWKVNAPQGRSLVSVYQGADWVRCVTPLIDISALPNPKLYFDLEVVVNASTNLDPKVEVYYTTNYSRSKFTGSPSSNGFTLLGTIDKNAANGQQAFDLPSGTNIYVLFAYKSVAADKETNGDKYWIDNIEVSQEFPEPATQAYYTEDFDALTGVVQKDISVIEANAKVKVFTDVASRNWYWQNNTVKAMMD
ncbi:MAG: hypothetical protein MI866_17910, partial [Bacteroidales bacterium]|nr:hypothetical protein [Bacteroidales bacterium]